MKYLTTLLLALTWALCLSAQTEVTYNLAYDPGTQTYTVSMTSNTTHNPPLSRVTNSSQVTIVAPAGWQLANLTSLTALNFGFSVLPAPNYGMTSDYFFISPDNAGTYSPFPIIANTPIDLFSFQSGGGCVGAIAIYENGSDPLDSVPQINGGNNMVILGAGPGNTWVANTSGPVDCATPCEANAGVLSY